MSRSGTNGASRYNGKQSREDAIPAPLAVAADGGASTHVVEHLPLSELVPYVGNARKHSAAQIAQLITAIKRWGFTAPVLIDERRQIVAGHGRVLAAQAMGRDTVPCVTLPGHWTDAERRAYIIADNKLALNAEWDFATLASELQELDTGEFPLTLTGFTEAELEQIATWTGEPKTDTGGGVTNLPQYQILIECADEPTQVTTLQKLIDLGIECRALVR